MLASIQMTPALLLFTRTLNWLFCVAELDGQQGQCRGRLLDAAGCFVFCEIIQCLSQEFGSAVIKLRGERNWVPNMLYNRDVAWNKALDWTETDCLFCFSVISELSAWLQYSPAKPSHYVSSSFDCCGNPWKFWKTIKNAPPPPCPLRSPRTLSLFLIKVKNVTFLINILSLQDIPPSIQSLMSWLAVPIFQQTQVYIAFTWGMLLVWRCSIHWFWSFEPFQQILPLLLLMSCCRILSVPVFDYGDTILNI